MGWRIKRRIELQQNLCAYWQKGHNYQVCSCTLFNQIGEFFIWCENIICKHDDLKEEVYMGEPTSCWNVFMDSNKHRQLDMKKWLLPQRLWSQVVVVMIIIIYTTSDQMTNLILYVDLCSLMIMNIKLIIELEQLKFRFETSHIWVCSHFILKLISSFSCIML